MLYRAESLAVALALRKIPRAPFAGCQYLTTVTTLTDETTSTFSGVNIGTPHPDRVIVLAIHQGVNADVSAATVAGNGFYHKERLNEFSVAAVAVPNNMTSAIITVASAGSLRKAVGVFVCYPWNPIPLDSANGSATTTTNAVVSNLEVQAGGCLIYSGGQNATLGAFTTTWSGSEALVEDVDAQYESASSYTHGHIQTLVATTQSDLTLAETVSGTKRLCATTFGPPRYYGG